MAIARLCALEVAGIVFSCPNIQHLIGLKCQANSHILAATVIKCYTIPVCVHGYKDFAEVDVVYVGDRGEGAWIGCVACGGGLYQGVAKVRGCTGEHRTGLVGFVNSAYVHDAGVVAEGNDGNPTGHDGGGG